MSAQVFHTITLIHVTVTELSGEPGPRTVTREASLTHEAVRTAADALRSLADFVVVGTGLDHIRAVAGAEVQAGGTVAAGRAGTGVEGSFTARTGESVQTAAAERSNEVDAGGVVETRRA